MKAKMSTDNNVGITIAEVKGSLGDLNEKLASESGQEWLGALKLFLKKQNPWEAVVETAKAVTKKVEIVVKTVATNLAAISEGYMKALVTGISIPEVAACKVADCFTDTAIYAYRDSDLDQWLSADIPATEGGRAINFQLVKEGMTFKKMTQVVLGLPESRITELGRSLYQSGKTWSLRQVDETIVRYERGEKTLNLRDDGFANFFFVHDENGSVFVVYADRVNGRWSVRVYRLDGGDVWFAEYRLFLRN